jgi:hypothetical protein
LAPKRFIHIKISVLAFTLFCVNANARIDTTVVNIDTAMLTISPVDTAMTVDDSINFADAMSKQSLTLEDTAVVKKYKRDWTTWRPDVKKAMWLALVLPGAGQIYNRKYWKLPIFYGGMVGCVYAMTWNNQMYHDYAQAYIDIMDDDPTTESYTQFLHLGKTINDSNKSRYQELFRKRKDRYRRWRDLSFFVMVGVYAVSVIDAYVDASLSEFDISEDLSMSVAPTILNNQTERNPLKSSAIGLSIGFHF